MNVEFVTRVIRISVILSILGFLFVAKAFGVQPGLGFLAGAAWSTLSLWLLKLVITNAFAKEVNKKRILVLFVLKFPVLYLSGFLLVFYGKIHGIGAVAGFSLPLAVCLLKAGGRVWTVKEAVSETEAGGNR